MSIIYVQLSSLAAGISQKTNQHFLRCKGVKIAFYVVKRNITFSTNIWHHDKHINVSLPRSRLLPHFCPLCKNKDDLHGCPLWAIFLLCALVFLFNFLFMKILFSQIRFSESPFGLYMNTKTDFFI